MKVKIVFSILFFVSLLHVYTPSRIEPIRQISYVTFNDTNFEEFRNKFENILIYFTASWKNETDERKIILEKVRQELSTSNAKERDNYLIMGEVDSKNYKIFHDYNVQKYPSIALIEGNSSMKYKGDFESEKILEWVNHLLSKQIIKLNSYEEVREVTKSHHSIMLFYGDAETHKTEYQLYYNFTGRFPDLHFYHFTNASIVPLINTTQKISEPAIIIHKKFDEKVNVYEGAMNENELNDFIGVYSRPVLTHLDSDSYMYIMSLKKSFLALITDDEDEEKAEALEDKFYSHVLKYRKQIMAFAGDLYTTLTSEFQVKKADLPVILIEEVTENGSIRRYKSSPSDFEGDGIETFLQNFFERKLKKFLKSEKIPDEKNSKDGNIHRLVGENFNSFIEQENKWILVFFTRKKCNMCDEFYKGFKQISEEFSSISDLQFAVIDGEMNDLEQIDIKGFPTVILFKKGKDKFNSMVNFDQIASYYNIKDLIEGNVGRLDKSTRRDEL